MAPRVVVTGLGAVTAFGVGKEAFWQGVLSGTVASGPVRSFDAAPYGVDRGVEIPDFDPRPHLCRLDPAAIGRAAQLAAVAARQALADARLADDAVDADRAGVVMGTTTGEAREVERLDDALVGRGGADLDSAFALRYPCHGLAANVAREVGFRGPLAMIPAACAAGNYAIAQAADLLRSHRAEVMLAGGSDPFSRITYAGFARLGAIAPDRCRPFDRARRGMIPAEGAGVLVLETLEHAVARGAPVYAEVVGYGLSCDAHHMTGAHPQGDGALRAMQQALATAGRAAAEVSYVSAHGTGTPTNDTVEVIALERLLGERAPEVPVSSIKSMLGHSMGAASALEAIVCALAVAEDQVPPTANFEAPDDGCRLDFVPNRSRRVRVELAMNNAYAFGGNNASVLFAKVPAGAGR
jgi:3-oxoacyl-[acyl-carrier-protein] synthase II